MLQFALCVLGAVKLIDVLLYLGIFGI